MELGPGIFTVTIRCNDTYLTQALSHAPTNGMCNAAWLQHSAGVYLKFCMYQRLDPTPLTAFTALGLRPDLVGTGVCLF